MCLETATVSESYTGSSDCAQSVSARNLQKNMVLFLLPPPPLDLLCELLMNGSHAHIGTCVSGSYKLQMFVQ